jgi:hypothetical protein
MRSHNQPRFHFGNEQTPAPFSLAEKDSGQTVKGIRARIWDDLFGGFG